MTDKDQAAIDHVASVSKNPHAAMIVKWLITGWDVVYRGQKDRLVHPCWSKDDEYELIEPKPAKPAYRVYIEKSDGSTYTQDAINGNRDKTLLPEKYEWLSDWIEYDPPKKWPTPLVERIASIDMKAAEWIVENWDNLLDEKYTSNGTYNRTSEKLLDMFCWDSSEQNQKYWEEISNKLGE